MAILMQPAFAKGEIAPDVFGRVDIAAYAVALEEAKNVRIRVTGGAENRPGSQFIGPVKDHTYAPRLIDFEFNTQDTYMLEFGDKYIRFIRNGAYVTDPPVDISGYTQANPVVVTTAVAHNLSDGDEVFIVGIVDASGHSALNDQRYIVQNVTATTFELTDQVTGANVDGTGLPAYSSGGTSAKIYEIETPYVKEELYRLKHAQSADVMTLTHPLYPVYNLSRTDHNSWSLDEVLFEPETDGPTDVEVTAVTTGTTSWRYKVTGINPDTQEESLPGLSVITKVITNITNANPARVTSTAHGVLEGDLIYIKDVVGMTQVNDRYFIATNITDNAFDLLGEDSTTYSSYTSGGTVYYTYHIITDGDFPADNTITWTPAPGITRYAVYKFNLGTYGWIGETEQPSFRDFEIDPDMSIAPPNFRNPFKSPGNYPGAVSFYEQRKVYGGTLNQPDTTFYSKIGSSDNFSRSTPLQQDDAITATLNARKVNEIRHFVPGNDLAIFTSGSEWMVNAGSDNAFAFDTLRQRPQTYWGSSHIEPAVFGETTLFVGHNNYEIRSFTFDLQRNLYLGDDVNLLSPHIFREFSIVDMSYVKSPFSMVYTVRSDGDMPVLSFNNEQEVLAWTQWSTDGDYESVGVVSGSTPDHLYDEVFAVVKRQVDGNTVRYVERFDDRRFNTLAEGFFVDCGLTYEGPATGSVTGLWHLEGREVYAVGDGIPYTVTVTNGAITLPDSNTASIIHVGLPYTSWIKTLRIEASGGNTIQGRFKSIPEVIARVKDTRGLKVGETLDSLMTWRENSRQLLKDPETDLYTGDMSIKPKSSWGRRGQLYFVQDQPLPWTILASIANIELQDDD